MILLVITIFLFLFYAILLLYYWRNWEAIPEFVRPSNQGHPKISVIVPARNEEENIGALLEAILSQDYPNEYWELIVVDDHSTDRTAEIVQQHQAARLISLQEDGINSYKKKALETGIQQAGGEWIVCTDADCIPPKTWLTTMAAFIESRELSFVVAPVIFSQTSLSSKRPILAAFQELDFMILQGITGAAVHRNIHAMCNGANLAYRKQAFNEVGGFSGIDAIASGDDMLLMYKIAAKYPGTIGYLKSREAIVPTQPMKTWREFFQQRIRWASKAAKYEDKRIILVLAFVYLYYVWIACLFVSGFWHHRYWLLVVAFGLLKILVEFPFCLSVARFFDRQRLVQYLFLLQPLHKLYVIISGLFGQFGKYEWKGRRVK